MAVKKAVDLRNEHQLTCPSCLLQMARNLISRHESAAACILDFSTAHIQPFHCNSWRLCIQVDETNDPQEPAKHLPCKHSSCTESCKTAMHKITSYVNKVGKSLGLAIHSHTVSGP